MNWLTRQHGRKTPPGLEMRIWKKLPLMTVAGSLIVVHIMKGPAYSADSLPVEHADRPGRDEPEQRK